MEFCFTIKQSLTSGHSMPKDLAVAKNSCEDTGPPILQIPKNESKKEPFIKSSFQQDEVKAKKSKG